MLKDLMSYDQVQRLIKNYDSDDRYDDLSCFVSHISKPSALCSLKEVMNYIDDKTIIAENTAQDDKRLIADIVQYYLPGDTFISLYEKLIELPDILTLEELKNYFSMLPNDWVTILLMKNFITAFQIEGKIRIMKSAIHSFLSDLLKYYSDELGLVDIIGDIGGSYR